MSRTVVKFLFSLILCFVSIEYAKADVVWPTLYIARGMYSIPGIILGLLVEIFFVKVYMEVNWLKASQIGTILNAASATVGCFIIVFAGLPAGIIESILHIGYIVSFAFCVAVNVILEGGILSEFFDKQYKDTYKWLIHANIISVAIAYMSYELWSDHTW